MPVRSRQPAASPTAAAPLPPFSPSLGTSPPKSLESSWHCDDGRC